MGIPYDTSLPPDLRALKEEIEGYARGFGLDFYETIFEVLEAEDLNEVAAYGGFPTRYPHWSFGMAYEELIKGYDYGLSKIYEMVINNDPCYAYLMRCNHTVDQKLVMAHVYGHCLAPETKVETKGGVKRIADVGEGERVLTHRGAYQRVRIAAKRQYEGPIYRISVAGSSEPVRITGEHPIYVLRPRPCVLAGRSRVPCKPTCKLQHKCSAPRPYEGYELQWVVAAQVKVGDYVVMPRRRAMSESRSDFVDIPFDKILHRQRLFGSRRIPVNADLGKFIGYYVAEGNAQPRGLVGFGFHQNEIAIQTEVAELSRQVFGVNVGRDEYPEQHATTVRFNALEVANWLRDQVGTSAGNKRIPSFVMDCPDERVTQACVQGAFHGDGYWTTHQGRRSGALSLTTISEQFAYQLRDVCSRWGVQTAIKSRQRPQRQTVYEVIWTGESAHKLSKIVYGEDVIRGNRSFERSWSDERFVYQPIRSIAVEEYNGVVHNFSVAEDESYTLAAGMVVHNCDFFKNNAYFSHTNRKMMDEMANHGMRMRRYAERYGEDEVEAFVDKCMSIDDLIDIHSTAIRRREEVLRYDFKPKEDEESKPTRFKSKFYMDDYINPREALKAEEEAQKKEREQVAKNFPERPEKDVLLFLIDNAPLKPWQRDVLSIVRNEAYYFAPQGQTKIINEGWACADRNTLLFSNKGCLRLGDVVDKRQEIDVSDGATARRVYDWAKFPDQETVWIKSRRGLELEGSVTHRVMQPGGSWQRLDQVEVGSPLQVSPGVDLWATEVVALAWKPQSRITLTDVASTAGVDLSTVMRHKKGTRGHSAAVLTPLLDDYEVAKATLSFMQSKRRAIRVPEIVDENLAAVLGYLTGDGHISNVKRVIGLTTGDEEQADRFASLIRSVFGIEPRKKRDGGRWRILFSSRTAQDFLVHLGMKTGVCAREKVIPDVILHSPKAVVVSFLRAYYDCDGYAGKAGVILSTSSVEMSKTVQLLLLNFGILSTRRPHKDGCWHVHTMGRSAAKFLEEIGFGLERKQQRLRDYVQNHQWFKEEDWTDEIVALERRRADVYDISVAETHRYAAQGFINHNSFWHSTIMTQKALSPSEVIDFADHHSGTMATQRGRINPYKLGIELLRDIEERWNTGRFGKEYDDCDDLEKRRTWDKKLGLGRQKIFEVRRVHNDITFIDTYLTPEFCARQQMFSYAFNEQQGNYVIESREFQKIKQRLLFSLTNHGRPWIYVVDGNYRNRGELLLRHEYNGLDLKLDRAADTLANVQFVWGRPVHLQTVVEEKPTLLSFDGSDHSIKNLGDADDPRKHAAGKTK